MKFTGIDLQILDKIRMQRLSFPKDSTPLFQAGTLKENNKFLRAKNVILSGEFFPMSKNSFEDKLQQREVNVQPEITPETEILICGQYPDWVLVEEARHYGIRIIFADKTGESFSRIATKLIKNKTTAFPIKELIEV